MKPVYHSLILKISPDHAEDAYAVLYESGCAGIVEDDDQGSLVLKAYFENHPEPDSLVTLGQPLSLEPPVLTEIGLNANQFIPAPYDPFHLSGVYWISPPQDLFLSDLRAPDNAQSILIKPGVAFGSGRHQTTRLCARLMEDFKQDSLLDVGTGSGILALLASHLGFKSIDAVEISQEALENARDNFKLNQASNIQLLNDIQLCTETYDVVVANILTPTILYLKEELLRCLKPKGILILSGITESEYPSILQAFVEMKKVKEVLEESWVGVAFQKQ